jgi:uncharacterized membrane protein/mono/diheme cytochrome c family protein
MNLIYFLGRFHVLALHIPIGIIIAVFVLELLIRREKYRHLEPAAAFLWIAAAASAILTVILGYMHFAEGAFVGPSAAQHRTFGTALAIIITVVAVLRASRFSTNYKPVFFPAAILMVLLASITGHYGGNLTHGSTYLVEYAPQPLRSLAGLAPRRTIESYAAIDPYLDLIAPMFESRCSSCHNEDKRESDLVLTSYEGLMRGGENGTVVVAGRPDFSELYNRITLPSDDESFMPAEGKTPLTEAQVAIIEWWIAARLPTETTLDQVELPPDAEVEALIRTEVGLPPDA